MANTVYLRRGVGCVESMPEAGVADDRAIEVDREFGGTGNTLEREISLLSGVVHVANAGTGPHPHAKPNRCEYHAIALLVVDAGATNVIETAIHCRKALEYLVGGWEVVDQYKNFGDVGTEVESAELSAA